MIEKTNQVKMFKASTQIDDYNITANVRVDMTDSLLSIDSGSVTTTTSATPIATFYLYEGGSLSITSSDKSNITTVSQSVSDFITQLTPSK